MLMLSLGPYYLPHPLPTDAPLQFYAHYSLLTHFKCVQMSSYLSVQEMSYHQSHTSQPYMLELGAKRGSRSNHTRQPF